MQTIMTMKRFIALNLAFGLCHTNAQDIQEPILGGVGRADECHNTVRQLHLYPELGP